MQKKLIALAVAGVMAAPMAAQAASAEVYGKVRLSVDAVSNDDQSVNHEDGKLSVTSHSSRVGFKGSEDLDGGMTAVYQIETEVDLDNDQGFGHKMRDTYVGLAGSAGTVVLGIHDTPYKDATGKVEIFGDTHGDYNAIIGDTHDARADNVIAYISPDMSGFTLFAAYVTDLADDNLVDTTDSTAIGGTTREQQGISVAGMYSAGPLYAALAFQSLGESGVQNGTKYDDAEGTKLALGYNIGMTDLGFVYENDDLGGSNNDQDRMYFSVKQDMGNDMDLKFAYGMADDRGNTNDSGASFYALGVSKKMAETVELYALYAGIDNDANAAFDLDEVGSAGATEASASVLSAGINLKFSSM